MSNGPLRASIGAPGVTPVSPVGPNAPIAPAVGPAAGTGAPAFSRDRNFARAQDFDAATYELGALPFETTAPATPAPPAPSAFKRDILLASDMTGWLDAVKNAHQAGQGGVLEDMGRRQAPGGRLPVNFEHAVRRFNPSPRKTLEVAQAARALGRDEATTSLAATAGDKASDRATLIAAGKLADRLGGRTEAEHVLFREAQRAKDQTDALATARRANSAGYPDAAKYAYFKAAQLAPNAPMALAAAREATQSGLRYDADEPAFTAWRDRLDARYVQREQAAGVPDAASKSPFRAVGLSRPRYINPYMAALHKAEPQHLRAIGRAATLGGEAQAAAMVEARLNATRPNGGQA